jgi:hypothetical protein
VVVLGVVVVVDGVVVVDCVVVVVVEGLSIAAKAAPPPATSAPQTANTRTSLFMRSDLLARVLPSNQRRLRSA